MRISQKMFICNHFGHKYVYGFTQDSPRRNFKFCKRCGMIWELSDRYLPAYKKGWFGMVTYTANGAKEHLGEYYESK